MEKRIAVVTWGGLNNFGTVLQGFSLVTAIERLGYKVYFYSKYQKKNKTIKKTIKRLLTYLGFKRFKDKQSYKYDIVNAFRRQYHHEILCKNSKEKQDFIKSIDVFVTGSDQIWNTYFRYDPFFFWDFAGNRKRIAYSSSIGTNSVKEEYKDAVRAHLMKFAHIGVRELEGVRALEELTGRNDIKHVLDPVYLLSAKDWKEYSSIAPYTKKKLPSKYLVCYFVGNNEIYHTQLEDVKKKYGIDKVINITAHYEPKFLHPNSELYNEAHPFDFVYLIQHSTLVCTDSFHAMSLSIILSKDFVLFQRFTDTDKVSQNSRVLEILEHFKLRERLYDMKSKNWVGKINYQGVQSLLENDRITCLNYLKKSIEE